MAKTGEKQLHGSGGKLATHEHSQPHLQAASDYHARNAEGRSSVGVHLSQAYADKLKRDAEEKARNRSVLCTVVDVIRFLAKQNISFRGADESACSRNRGNFLELVHYTAK